MRYTSKSVLYLVLFLTVSGLFAEDFNLDQLNYGFASYLGTGLYSVAGEDVQIYKIPVSHQLATMTKQGLDAKFKVPVTLGFYDFELQDVVDTGLPDTVTTLSVVPGMEFLFQIDAQWQFGAFYDLGIATNLENQDANYVSAVGLLSRYHFDTQQPNTILANRLLYVKFDGADVEDADDFASFETVLDFRFGFSGEQRDTTMSVYLAHYRYFDNLTFLSPRYWPVKVFTQNEIGITFKIDGRNKQDYIDIPWFGIGYRFGDDLSIVRILFSTPY